MTTIRAVCVGLFLLVASCSGKPDASGIYVEVEDQAVTFVQLVQADDEKLTGRIEVAAIGRDGAVIRKEATEQGSISGHNVILQPVSIWYGGVQASGTLSGDTLTLTREGNTLVVKRSSLADYQQAVSALEAKAAQYRQAIAAAKDAQNAAEDAARRSRAIGNANDQLAGIAQRLVSDTVKLNEAITHCPDFGRKAAANTAIVTRMATRASSLGDTERSQLGVEANQVEVATNQIEIDRSQYAILLNGIAGDAGEAKSSLNGLCGANSPAELAQGCAKARSALGDFDGAMAKGQAVFLPYKAQVQKEMRKQARLAAHIV